jgi:Zn-finger nucleic acid-binding protein
MQGNRKNMEQMPAETLNCPMCGAAATSDATKCDHCGARLATVACPSCFGLIFQGAKFCSHCGARVERAELATPTQAPCPRCRIDMPSVVIGATTLRECSKCEGIWADTATLQQIYADREKQAAVLGLPTTLHATDAVKFEEHIHYLPCPVCRQLMNRVNFARCSHVIVDVCRTHGTWFDKDELREIIEFIRGGGMDAARARELEELQQQRRELDAARITGGMDDTGVSNVSYRGSRNAIVDIGLSAVADTFVNFLFGK